MLYTTTGPSDQAGPIRLHPSDEAARAACDDGRPVFLVAAGLGDCGICLVPLPGGRDPLDPSWSVPARVEPDGSISALGPIPRDLFSEDPLPTAHRGVVVAHGCGIHLRIAERIVCLAQRHQAEISVRSNGAEVDGRSILDLLTLAAECGSRVELSARGDGAQAAVDALAVLLSSQGEGDDLGLEGLEDADRGHIPPNPLAGGEART